MNGEKKGWGGEEEGGKRGEKEPGREMERGEKGRRGKESMKDSVSAPAAPHRAGGAGPGRSAALQPPHGAQQALGAPPHLGDGVGRLDQVAVALAHHLPQLLPLLLDAGAQPPLHRPQLRRRVRLEQRLGLGTARRHRRHRSDTGPGPLRRHRGHGKGTALPGVTAGRRHHL